MSSLTHTSAGLCVPREAQLPLRGQDSAPEVSLLPPAFHPLAQGDAHQGWFERGKEGPAQEGMPRTKGETPRAGDVFIVGHLFLGAALAVREPSRSPGPRTDRHKNLNPNCLHINRREVGKGKKKNNKQTCSLLC